MYAVKEFDNSWAVVEWLNKNRIRKANIISVTQDERGKFILIYAKEESLL